MKANVRGFTLTELLIAVAIMGILVKMAYPSYLENIKQGKRAEAKAALVSFANAMEMWKMQNNNSYLGAGPGGAATGAPTVFQAWSPVSKPVAEKDYDLEITVATATAYTLSAKLATGKTDATCGNLTITNTGVTTPTTAGCW
ncbi:MAG: prepilin-type N-terminal cleavage/methylation domain-containing protein [Methylococcaceae bacterium]|nr:prepilin-type N-terminal cleavage/methylation domain-containing protein [Methylococcaceae bacterium]